MTLNPSRNRTKTQAIVYGVLWIIVVGLYLLGAMRRRAQMSESLLDAGVFYGMARTILPLFILFCINNWLLIPRLILKNRWKIYIGVIVLIFIGLWCYQYYDFMEFERSMQHHGERRPLPSEFRPLVPMPVLLDITYGLLVVGVNLAITLMFQRYDDKLERESMRKANAENQLAYLKAQINPHFYLNMLNNIHGMIDIDSEKAQAMLIDMSKLMRFMLYDSAKPRISLADEVSFLENYLELMRQRYPSERVEVTWNFPPKEKIAGVFLPPLLFLSFIENAFKHGVSYRSSSYIAVSIGISDNAILFGCMNSVAPKADSAPDDSPGIGLKNVKERLRLLYGNRADLTIHDAPDKFTVSLTLPVHDVENPDN